jgi:hypothetical protein
VEADYCVDKIPDHPTCSGLLYVTQHYVFFGAAESFLPLDVADIAEYRPYIHYDYCPPLSGKNDFVVVKMHQRFDFELAGATDNAAFHVDNDLIPDLPGHRDPPANEMATSVAAFGFRGGQDNYHQRAGGLVFLPGCSGFPWDGFWQCAHVHWRWGAYLPLPGAGTVLPPASQFVAATLVVFHAGEIDPPAFSLTNLLMPLEPIGVSPRDLVMWQSSESFQSSDRFSQNDWFFR